MRWRQHRYAYILRPFDPRETRRDPPRRCRARFPRRPRPGPGPGPGRHAQEDPRLQDGHDRLPYRRPALLVRGEQATGRVHGRPVQARRGEPRAAAQDPAARGEVGRSDLAEPHGARPEETGRHGVRVDHGDALAHGAGRLLEPGVRRHDGAARAQELGREVARRPGRQENRRRQRAPRTRERSRQR